MSKDTVIYRGRVNLAIKKGKHVLYKSTHNAGLPDMSLMFAKAITGNLEADSDIPRFIDIGYVDNTVASADSFTKSNGVWQSILNEPCNIGGRQYKFDSSLNNWVGILIATVYYSDLIGGENLDSALGGADDGRIQLKVRLCSYNTKDRKYLAEIDISADEIRKLKHSTSAIFTWYTELLYNEEMSSDNISGDVTVDND